ncbi:MAG: hypothetical protein QW767_02430 [Thermoprotei archaeon]
MNSPPLSFPWTIAFSAVMGLSIFLTLPLTFKRNPGQTGLRLLVSVATGILVFLIADVFSDVSNMLYDGSLYGYGSSPPRDAAFAFSLIAGFAVVFLVENSSKTGLTPSAASYTVALGIGFQNLTEGLLFGSLGSTIGLSGYALVVLFGFVLQNITEGFPIAVPLIGKRDTGTTMFSALLLGGAPTILGGAVGYYYSTPTLSLVFDGLAVGAMIYVVLPMMKSLFRNLDYSSQRLVYAAILLGFLVGFAVNLF